MSRKISQKGIAHIKNFEGLRLKAYKPVKAEKYFTIGYGHYGEDVKEGQVITAAQAEQMLINDLPRYEAFVNNPAYVPLTAQLNQNQFDVLVSFCYNCGQGSLQMLCRKPRTLKDIATKLLEYNKGSGEVLPGLVRRRKAEQVIFNTPIADESVLTPEGGHTLSVADANYAIEYLKKSWDRADTKEEKARIGRIADRLRIASGQPPENV